MFWLFLFLQKYKYSAYEKENGVYNQITEAVQQKIIDIGYPIEEKKLHNFDGQRKSHTGGNYLAVGIQIREHSKPNDANRNEHGRVSDDIDKHCPADFVIQQIFDGIQVQSNGEDPGGIEDQRLNFAIHLGEWEKVTLAATARQIKPASASIPNEVRNFHCVYRHKILSKVTGS